MVKRRLGVLALVAALLAGCGGLPGLGGRQSVSELVKAKGVPGADQPFPGTFMWGVATAGYQYEGNDTTSNWVAWQKAGKTAEPLGAAIDGYNRWAQDLDLAAGMGLNAYRMSIEWSRIEPVRGQFDPAAIAHYHQVLEGCLQRGMTPIVTINHFTYPAWLDAPLSGGPGGWESPESLVEFRHYAQFLAREYGHQVRYWITLNEPNVLALGGYMAGIFPPGKRDPFAYRNVLDRLMLAHRAASQAIHEVSPQAMASFNPFVMMYKSTTDAVADQDRNLNPDECALIDIAMGKGQASASPTLDYLSFDWYQPISVGTLPNLSNHWAWTVYPEGLYQTAKALWSRYKLPILIAENGMATDGDKPRADGWSRSAFLVNHLAQLRRAMAEGVSVIGYMHWSLVDNYEWGTYRPSFGLFAIDRRDTELTRLRTEAVGTYSEIARQNALTASLLERYLGKKN